MQNETLEIVSNNTIDITYTTTEKFNFKRIFYLLVDSLEGGSNDWCHVDKINPPINFNNIKTGHKLYDAALNDGGSLEIVEKDDCKTDPFFGNVLSVPKTAKRHVVNVETIKKGLELMEKTCKNRFLEIVNETSDHITADLFLQLVCLGELVYC